MRKIAIFVEGLAEQIFVREMLLRVYGYTNVGIQCYKLHAQRDEKAPYPFPNGGDAGPEEQDNYYMIVNVEGENMVLSAIKSRITRLQDVGFEKIIGLRDMYCDEYHRHSKRQIDNSVSERFIRGHDKQIELIPHQELIRFFFAIMEVEAWFLGFEEIFSRIDPKLTTSYIREQTGIDLTNDPETTIYHPAEAIRQIFLLIDKTYKKHEHEISSIIDTLTKEDYLLLAENSSHCSTFKCFYNELIT